MKHYDFLNRTQYFQALTQAAARAKAGERMTIATMSFSPGSAEMAAMIQAFRRAAKRGVRITLIVDAITLLANGHDLPLLSFSLQKLKVTWGPIARRYQALETLKAAGVDYRVINIPTRPIGLVQQGRSHIKCAVIGDEVYIGGCNLSHPHQLDIMVRWRDGRAAQTLANWLERIIDTDQTRSAFADVDIQTQLDADTSLLLDAGVPKQSLIYEEALSLIDAAQKWLYMTCQYFPGGETARHLAAAQARGVAVTINYSHPRAHGLGTGLQHAHQLRQRLRGVPSSLFSARLDKQLPKLHAKILISEKAALVGSHNYVSQGVALGTAELALRSTNPIFGQQLREFIQKQINALTK